MDSQLNVELLIVEKRWLVISYLLIDLLNSNSDTEK